MDTPYFESPPIVNGIPQLNHDIYDRRCCICGEIISSTSKWDDAMPYFEYQCKCKGMQQWLICKEQIDKINEEIKKIKRNFENNFRVVYTLNEFW